MIVAELIQCNHRLSEIRDYTLAQVKTFLKSHRRLARQRLHDQLIIARAAQATADGFKGVESSLRD